MLKCTVGCRIKCTVELSALPRLKNPTTKLSRTLNHDSNLMTLEYASPKSGYIFVVYYTNYHILFIQNCRPLLFFLLDVEQFSSYQGCQ